MATQLQVGQVVLAGDSMVGVIVAEHVSPGIMVVDSGATYNFMFHASALVRLPYDSLGEYVLAGLEGKVGTIA